MTTSTMHMLLLTRNTEYLFQNTFTMYIYAMYIYAERGKCIVNASHELKSTLKQ